MISTYWLEKRKPHWEHLEALLNECAQHGIAGLTRTELRELTLLYRQTAADLSALREDRSSQNFARYVNQLLARAHNTIYAGRKSTAKDIWHFYRYDYPEVFRRTATYAYVALGLFAAGAVLGLLLTIARPEFMRQMLGPHMVSTIEKREMWTHSIVGMKPVASAGIMTNNLGVSFVTFASGITGGLLTLYLLLFNGLLIGVIGAACFMSGMSLKLWSFVAPHGVLELPAIFISGGAGLRIATGLLFPGTLKRRDSLIVAGRQAVRLVLGTIPMLIVAGVLEAFVSPTAIPVPLKFVVAALMFACLATYLSLPGESSTKAEVARDADEVSTPGVYH